MAVRQISILLLFAAFIGLTSCAGEDAPATPKETFLTYSKARKKKDLTTMKMLLSEESKKMHEQEAKAMGIPLSLGQTYSDLLTFVIPPVN